MDVSFLDAMLAAAAGMLFGAIVMFALFAAAMHIDVLLRRKK